MSFPKLLDKTFAFFTLSFLLICLTGNAQNIDLLLKGGHVIDPKNGISETMDIAISGKQIIKVAKNIPEKTAKKTIDLKGY